MTAYRGLDGVEVYFRDIGDRKRAEERQKLLVAELSHRVKNTLASVQSIATQTLHTAGSPETFREAFTGRLLALSQTHDLLFRSNWQGASLRDVAMAELRPHLGDPNGRLDLEGDDVHLGPRTALALGMAFHELATNAAKYGALSVATGRIRIAWAVLADGGPGGRLVLNWTEVGGPPVRPPKHRGFGSTLIEKGLVYELDGEVTLTFGEDGVRCTMKIPLGPESEEIGADI